MGLAFLSIIAKWLSPNSLCSPREIVASHSEAYFTGELICYLESYLII